MIAENPATLTFDTIVEWYSSIANNSDNYFSYKIKTVPTSSFMEQLDEASSVCIDGNFIFNISKADLSTLEEFSDIVLDCSFTSDHGDLYEYEITLEEANNAQYDSKLNAWITNGLAINFYDVSPL